jgi:hypothetical protein
MNKKPFMDKLQEKWVRYYQEKEIPTEGFSRDGIVDEDKFTKANRRILFVLRETNEFPQSNEFGGDLRAFLSQTLKWQLWHTVGRWAYGILNDFPDYLECNGRRKIHDALCQVAVINLKKITGGKESDLEEINETAHRDKEFIRREVDLIDPEVLVACGTRGHLVWLFGLDDLPRRDQLPLSCSGEGNKKRLFLFTRHPVRAHNERSYNDLKRLWGVAQDLGYVR